MNILRTEHQLPATNRTIVGTICKLAGLACVTSALFLTYFLLPKFFEGERMVQRINCISNLKQIGIGFRLWEGDHGDQFPFNVSTNAGGAMERCTVDKEGFDINAYLYLRTMTDELTSPKILTCPQDHAKKPASDLASLQAVNVSYQFHSGTNITEANPQAILAVCPIHGNLLYCDGSVREVRNDPTPLRVVISRHLPIRAGSICAAAALVAALILLRLGFHLTARAKETGQ